jgi:flagellar basal-body rod protein FlgC
VYGTLDISTSGLVAQRTRMTVIAQNQANRSTILNAEGEYEPYRRRITVFAPGDPKSGSAAGVQVKEILEDPAPLQARYEPGSRFADEDGYVFYPNVNSVVEQMDAMEAQRAYDANISVAEGTKAIMESVLRLIA